MDLSLFFLYFLIALLTLLTCGQEEQVEFFPLSLGKIKEKNITARTRIITTTKTIISTTDIFV